MFLIHDVTFRNIMNEQKQDIELSEIKVWEKKKKKKDFYLNYIQ